MKKLVKLGVVAGVVGWLHSIGALDPKLWTDTIKRERERIPLQIAGGPQRGQARRRAGGGRPGPRGPGRLPRRPLTPGTLD